MAVTTVQGPKHLYEFGPFRLDPDKELLTRGGETVPLTPKTFQVLLVLMRHNNEVVTKDDLLKSVWPDTFVEEANLSRNIFLLRKALGESPQDHQYIVTVPGRGYRFAENVQLVPEQEVSIVAGTHTRVEVQVEESRRGRWWWIAAGAALALVAAVGVFRSLHHPAVLTEKDTVVLADFTNSTGDPVFDETLRQGLAVQLEQSPYVRLVSDARMRQTLQLMGQSADAQVNPDTAYQICQRTDSAVVIDGSIAALGDQYVLGLKAANCRTGDSIADEQERANGRGQVLAAMDRASVRLRQKLGESHQSMEQFDTPLEQATTPSLEALQAFSLGRKTQTGKGDFPGSVTFLRRAIQLDPNFAMAHATLGSVLWTLGETTESADHIRKAYELRAYVSEVERFYIETLYFHYVVGDFERAQQLYELSAHTFPRNPTNPIRLFVLYSELGQHDKALETIREAVRLDPGRGLSYTNLMAAYLRLDRLEDAELVAHQMETKQFDRAVHEHIYKLAFLRHDIAGMARQLEWASAKADTQFASREADTAAYSGQMKRSRDLSRQARELAIRDGNKEIALHYQTKAALTEVLYGNIGGGAQSARSVSEHAPPTDVQFGAALALALAGDSRRAQGLADDLARRLPEATIVQFNYLPVLRAQIALDRGDSRSAIEALRSAEPYELGVIGNVAFSPCLYPIYVRGNAYLAAHDPSAAVAEFEKILAHPGLVFNEPIGALARLQLGRAFAMAGDTARAKAAYQEFLALWKGADPDVPVLRQALAEYARLK